MSGSSDWAVQKAVYARLAAAAELIPLLAGGSAGVRDHVPDNSPFPYVVIGETASKPLPAADAGGREVMLVLHVFSRVPGFRETRTILAALQSSLHDADFSLEGHNLVLCLAEEASTSLDPDGVTRRGLLRLRLVTEPSP